MRRILIDTANDYTQQKDMDMDTLFISRKTVLLGADPTVELCVDETNGSMKSSTSSFLFCLL